MLGHNVASLQTPDYCKNNTIMMGWSSIKPTCSLLWLRGKYLAYFWKINNHTVNLRETKSIPFSYFILRINVKWKRIVTSSSIISGW